MKKEILQKETVLHEFFVTIGRVRQNMRQRIQQMLEKSQFCDLTLEMSQLLYVLNAFGGKANQQVLADSTGKNKSSITSLINNLIKREMIQREIDEANRRNNIISFTDKGEEFIRDFYPQVYDTYDLSAVSLDLANIASITEEMNRFMHA